MEEKQYLTIEEVAEYAGISRASVYNYMDDLGIWAIKPARRSKASLTRDQARQIKELADKPWIDRLLIRQERKKNENEKVPA